MNHSDHLTSIVLCIKIPAVYRHVLFSKNIITYFLFPLSDIMDLRHQSSTMCIIMLGGEDTHPWSASNVGNPIITYSLFF